MASLPTPNDLLVAAAKVQNWASSWSRTLLDNVLGFAVINGDPLKVLDLIVSIRRVDPQKRPHGFTTFEI